MNTVVCPKCQYLRQPTDQAPAAECPRCGVIYAKAEAFLTGRSSARTELASSKTRQRRPTVEHSQQPPSERARYLAFGGAIVLFVGVFMPLAKMPIIGQMNYFQNGDGDGVYLMVAAALAVILAASGRLRLLWLVGTAALGMLLFDLVQLQRMFHGAQRHLDALKDNPFRGLAEGMVGAAQIEWGAAVMIVGALMLLAAPTVDLVERRQR